MNLERMKQAAIEHSKENDKWAIVCSDGDLEFFRTKEPALTAFADTVDRVEFTSGEMRHDYGLVRVDVK